MRRSGVAARSLTEAAGSVAPMVPMAPAEAEVLTGLMLGDGSLPLGERARNAHLSVTRAARDLEYQLWTAGVFADRLTPRGVVVRDVHDARTGRTYQSAVLRTRSEPAFTEARRRWYPNGKKQVPAALTLTAPVVAVWLADDGSVTAASRRCPDIKLATHGFSVAEVEHLAGLLSRRYAGPVGVYCESESQR